MLARDHVLAPQVVKVEFALVPVFNVLESIQLLGEVERLSGLGEWVVRTASLLPPELLAKTRLVFGAFYPVLYKCIDPASNYRDFSEFLADLERQDPVEVANTVWDVLVTTPLKHPHEWPSDKPVPSRAQIMNDLTVYADFMDTLTGDCLNVDSWNEAYDLMRHPSQLLAMVTGHMQILYEDYLRPEWERVLPMLQESVAAFQKLDYDNLTVYEAIRAVTGRDMTNKLTLKSEAVDRLIFVPTAHIGPYIGQYSSGKTLYIMFGARLPRGVQAHSSDLGRAELLIRLNALADDTRLRILEMLADHEELCAQDIIEQLGLSQSTVSRHLSQLSASGYLTERRRDVAKCYSLNSDRVGDTLRALTHFLGKQ